MERYITGTRITDKIRSIRIRKLTGTKDIRYSIKKHKMKYAGHIKRHKEDSWERRELKWTSYGSK